MSTALPTYSNPQATSGDVKVPLEVSPQFPSPHGSPAPTSPVAVMSQAGYRDRILLFSMITSILFCVVVFVLSALTPTASAFLNIVTPLLLFAHHSLYLDKYYKCPSDSESRVARGILLVILLAGSVLTFVGGIFPLAMGYNDIHIAQGVLQIFHTFLVIIIAWRCWRALPKTSGAIRLPDDSNVPLNSTVPVNFKAWKPVVNASLPLPFWAVKISLEMCIVIPILAINTGGSPAFVLNIVTPILIVIHHLFLILVYTDKVCKPSNDSENHRNTEPLIPSFRRDGDGFVFISLVLLFVPALVGGILALVWSEEQRHWYYYRRTNPTALVQGILLVIESAMLLGFAIWILVKIFKKKKDNVASACQGV
ncbi:hypothetical protein Moror_9757 [Moniliophthora roreri MCA 2997]|nr:hypothetical protein Moror_9757 [Moniliophthora roreri MCA 2997]